jgi:hypothetical protein
MCRHFGKFGRILKRPVGEEARATLFGYAAFLPRLRHMSLSCASLLLFCVSLELNRAHLPGLRVCRDAPISASKRSFGALEGVRGPFGTLRETGVPLVEGKCRFGGLGTSSLELGYHLCF